MANIEVSFPGRSESFSVRDFRVEQAMSAPFTITLSARSEADDADLDGLAGSEAIFVLATHGALGGPPVQWTGFCASAEIVQAESTGLSTYSITIVPELTLLTQRTNCRVFRRMTAPEIALLVLREWGIEPALRIDANAYPVLDYRAQYNETDFAFLSRTLEAAGIAYFFRTQDERTQMVLADQPGQGELDGPPVPFHGDVSTAQGQIFATSVHRTTCVRSGAYRVSDYDFLHPAFNLKGDGAPQAREARFEQYEYRPGMALALGSAVGPVADAGATSEPRVLAAAAQRRLDAVRSDRKVLHFETNRFDLAPGSLTSIAGHPRGDIAPDARLLVTTATIEGTATGEFHMRIGAVFASEPFRPALKTPRPSIVGVQSATVVGPAEEEIYVDEHGRVRVLFPWDREGARDERSSAWVRVSQAWAGTGFGVVAIPRIGDEVLIAFVDGDPDQPIIVGRLYNATHLHPFRLPAQKTRTGIRTRTSRGGGGFNELSFEDRAGSEAIRIHAHKDFIEDVQNDHDVTVRQNSVERIGGNSSTRVEGTRADSIGQNAVLAIEGDRTELVSGTSTTTVEGSSHFNATGDREERLGASYQRSIEGSARLDFRGGKDERVSGTSTSRVIGNAATVYSGTLTENVMGSAYRVYGDTIRVTASAGASITAGHGDSLGNAAISEEGATSVNAPSILVQAGNELTLQVGSSRIVIKDKKITFDADTIEIAAKTKVALTTDNASTVWTNTVLAKADTIKAASSGASLELGDNAKLDGSKVQLKSSASVDKATFDRRAAELPTVPKTTVTLRDLTGAVISNAEYKVSLPGYIDRGTAAGGSIQVPVFKDIESCVVEWGRPVSARQPGASPSVFEFQSTIFLRTDVPGDAGETARRKLQNLGHQGDLHAAKHAFARRVGMTTIEHDAMLASSIDVKHGGS